MQILRGVIAVSNVEGGIDWGEIWWRDNETDLRGVVMMTMR